MADPRCPRCGFHVDTPNHELGCVPNLVKAMTREMLGDELMDRVEAEAPLTEREQASLDAFLTGDGYLVDGKRVDPRTVEVYRFDAKAESLDRRWHFHSRALTDFHG